MLRRKFNFQALSNFNTVFNGNFFKSDLFKELYLQNFVYFFLDFTYVCLFLDLLVDVVFVWGSYIYWVFHHSISASSSSPSFSSSSFLSFKINAIYFFIYLKKSLSLHCHVSSFIYLSPSLYL